MPTAAPAPKTKTRATGSALALLGALLVGVGDFLPWVAMHSTLKYSGNEWSFIGPMDFAKSDSSALTEGPFAIFMALAAAGLLIGIGIAVVSTPARKALGVFEALVGLAITLYAGYKMADILKSQTSSDSFDVFARTVVQFYPGPGLFLMLIAGLFVAAGGLRAAGSSPSS